MIEGNIDRKLEANLELNILLEGAKHRQGFIVDTGFNGYVAVPQTLVDRLGLTLFDVQKGITADGRSGFFDTVKLTVFWHGEPLTVQAQILDEALVGTRLLRGCRITADWIPGGSFNVELIR